MISPVSFGAGPSTAPARPSPEEVAKRLEGAVKSARTSVGISESRVRISPEGAQRAQADAKAQVQQRQQQHGDAVATVTPPPSAPPANPAPQAAAPAGKQAAPAELVVATNLAFDAADGNRDGTVTISEQQRFEVRTVRLSGLQPSDGRPGPAGSGPIRAYLDVDATTAGSRAPRPG